MYVKAMLILWRCRSPSGPTARSSSSSPPMAIAPLSSRASSGRTASSRRPQKLFTLPVEWSGFAPAPKGDRFLLLERVGNRSPSLTLVNNWRAQLAPER